MRRKRRACPHAIRGHLNNRPFPREDIATGQPARRFPEVGASGGFMFDLGQRDSMSASKLQRVTPEVVLINERASVEQMLLCPIHRVGGREPGFAPVASSSQCQTIRRELTLPQRSKLIPGHVVLFPRAFFVRQVLPNGFEVAVRLFGMLREKSFRLLVDLAMTLREPRAQLRRNFCDAEITARRVLDRVSARSKRTSQLMVIDVLDVFLRDQHSEVLQRLPPILRGVMRCIEDNAMRVQMRIEGSRSFMLKQRRNDVVGGSIQVGAGNADASGCE